MAPRDGETRLAAMRRTCLLLDRRVRTRCRSDVILMPRVVNTPFPDIHMASLSSFNTSIIFGGHPSGVQT